MEDEGAVHDGGRAKRARVGVAAADILGAIDADIPPRRELSEKRNFVELLLYFGRPSSARAEPLVVSVREQALLVANAFRFSADVFMEALFEWCVGCAGDRVRAA
jgi:hypothetical protein